MSCASEQSRGVNISVSDAAIGASGSPTEDLVHCALHEFTAGIDGVGPKDWVVEMANQIANAALDSTVEPEVSVDVDGALSFDLRLANGNLVLAELGPGGALDASVYDRNDSLIKRLPEPNAADLIALF